MHSGYTFFYQYVCSLGIEPTTFCVANAMLYHWATGTLFNTVFDILLENKTVSIQFHLIKSFSFLFKVITNPAFSDRENSLRGKVHPKMKKLSSFTKVVPNLYEFLLSEIYNQLTKQLMVPIDFHSMEKYYGNQWGPATVWLPTFFKISFSEERIHTGLKKLEE